MITVEVEGEAGSGRRRLSQRLLPGAGARESIGSTVSSSFRCDAVPGGTNSAAIGSYHIYTRMKQGLKIVFLIK